MVFKPHNYHLALIIIFFSLILQPTTIDTPPIPFYDLSTTNDLVGDVELFDNSYEAWKLVSSSGPSAREHTTMAYSSTNNVTLLFGGRNGNNNFSDTWIFHHNNNSWSELSITAPSARYGASMVYDVGDEVFILFGGMTSGGVNDEIWTFSYSTLSWLKSSTIMTSGRYFASATYYKRYDTTYIYGGITNTSSVSARLNSYNATTGGYSIVFEGSPIHSRYGHALIGVDYLYSTDWPDVFGPINAFQLMITGGYSQSGTQFQNGLEFDGSIMTTLSTVFDTPTAFHEMVFDDSHYRIYNFGGRNSTKSLSKFVVGDTVSSSLNPTWEIIDSGMVRTNHSMVWVEHSQELMIFGGSANGLILADTQTTQIYSPYGGPYIAPESDIIIESGDSLSVEFRVYDSVRFRFGAVWSSYTYPAPDPSDYAILFNGNIIEQGTWTTTPESIFANFTNLPLGVHNLSLWVNDKTGWSTEEFIEISVIDTIAPTLTFQEIYATGSFVTIFWLAEDVNPDSYTITFSNGTVYYQGTWQSNYPIGIALYQLPVGSYSLNLTVFDVSGNFMSNIVDVIIGVNTVVTPTVTSTVTASVIVSPGNGTVTSAYTVTEIITETTTEVNGDARITVTSEATTTITEPASYPLIIVTPIVIILLARRSWKKIKNK